MYQDFFKGDTKKEGLNPSFWTLKHLLNGLSSMLSLKDRMENILKQGGIEKIFRGGIPNRGGKNKGGIIPLSEL